MVFNISTAKLHAIASIRRMQFINESILFYSRVVYTYMRPIITKNLLTKHNQQKKPL